MWYINSLYTLKDWEALIFILFFKRSCYYLNDFIVDVSKIKSCISKVSS